MVKVKNKRKYMNQVITKTHNEDQDTTSKDVTAHELSTDDKIQNLQNAEKETIEILNNAWEQLKNLAQIRTDNKMSNSRVSGVAKELKELIKVMSVYA